MKESLKKPVREFYKLPEEVTRLANLASWDLWNGPIGPCDDYEDGKPYPGFSEACDVVSEWASDNLSDPLYVDDDCGMALESNPFDDPCNWEYELDNPDDAISSGLNAVYIGSKNVYELERKEQLQILFGKELAEYL